MHSLSINVPISSDICIDSSSALLPLTGKLITDQFSSPSFTMHS